MSRIANRMSGVLVALLVAGSAGAAFAQSANGGGGRGGEGGTSGGGATMVPATYSAVVPSNTSRQPQGRAMYPNGSGCQTPTEGIRGPRLMGPCGPY